MAKNAQPVQRMKLANLCTYLLGIAFFVSTAYCQQTSSEDDSLLMDSFRAAPEKTVKTQKQNPASTDSTVSLPAQGSVNTSNSNDSIDLSQPVNQPPQADTVQKPTLQAEPASAEPIRPNYNEGAPAVPIARMLSPFSSDKMNSFGISLDYFSYAEASDLTDIFPENFSLSQVVGVPKSTEYGLFLGFNYKGAFREHGSAFIVRPEVDVKLGLRMHWGYGIGQTYDGSTQVQAIPNPNGKDSTYYFFPVKFYKSNYFVKAGFDWGYCLTQAVVPFYVYTGVKGNFWYRDMLPDTTSYSNQITNSEMYYWFYAPLGIAVSKPISPTLAVGLDASCNLMFFGQMKALFSWWDPQTNFKTESPTVTLGNKIGFTLEASLTYKTINGNIFQIAPYFSTYAYGKSESEVAQTFVNGVHSEDKSFLEPASTTWFIGCKIRMLFLSPFTRAL